ncbi:MAG: 6,7-dimethyl-8-ribityllumazine synthase [Granulosicoccus sp.]|nr:6,7-dimethyl-8-ribityllumazine synthase [Granulosicoccus sp.]
MAHVIEGKLIGTGLRIGIVCTRWNDFMGQRMLDGAKDALLRHDVADGDITIAVVPGCFEIPLVAKKMAESGQFDALVCLGVLIRGGTIHFDLIAGEVSKGISSTSWQTGIPTTFGVITTETMEQAIERAGSKAGNKGVEAALAAIEMANLLKAL